MYGPFYKHGTPRESVGLMTCERRDLVSPSESGAKTHL